MVNKTEIMRGIIVTREMEGGREGDDLFSLPSRWNVHFSFSFRTIRKQRVFMTP